MLFNSVQFLAFFPVVFLSLWLLFHRTKASQNTFLLVCSYAFYMAWDWRFSLLLAFSTVSCYWMANRVEEASSMRIRRLWMRACVVLSLLVLGFFKYFGFFAQNLGHLLALAGLKADMPTLSIILPIGISFYTFHGLSYVLDVYYSRIRTHRNIVDYALFVAYFPLLVAGPIERATHLLPQLTRPRAFRYSQAVSGFLLACWGMWKKVVVADNVSPFVDRVFNNWEQYSGPTLAIAVLGFAVQVYADFSGYTDIARGVSRILGIELIRNFNFPYSAKTIPEFWSRWHMSLSSWLNDYVFTPIALALRDYGRHGIFIAVMATFLISGLWHGAAWHFVFWGAFHGLMYLPYIYRGKGLRSLTQRKLQEKGLRDLPYILLTFLLVCIGYVFFRATDSFSGIGILGKIFTVAPGLSEDRWPSVFVFGGMLFLTECVMISDSLSSHFLGTHPLSRMFRYGAYLAMGVLIVLFWGGLENGFIYFQF
jgi:D-alanyl-lipoteichoic acid acyltransferase DltB (MBOAT superfamily)